MGKFLLEFSEKQRKYRSRICFILNKVMALESWRAAADGEESLRLGIGRLLEDDGVKRQFSFDTVVTIPTEDPSIIAAAASSSTSAGQEKSSDVLWAVWLSLDPRTSELRPYPSEVAHVLEGAWHRGDDCVDLGNFFRGAVVHLR